LPPESIELQYLDGTDWKGVPDARYQPPTPIGRRANHVQFSPLRIRQLRAVLRHRPNSFSGLSEFEAWGTRGTASLDPPSRPASLATNTNGEGFPKASASHTSRFDRVECVNDGTINYRPSPNNRWTAYESPNSSDWVEIDFGQPRTVGRVELHIYDDRGGVQPPASYTVQFAEDDNWKNVANIQRLPAKPQGGAMNTVTFDPVEARKLRVVFTHAGSSRSGLTELEAWEK
jgi:hypothetical protein